MSSVQDFSFASSKPTKAEKLLLIATQNGEKVDFSQLPKAERFVSGELIRAIAMESFKHPLFANWSLHQNGLSLACAIINDQVNLEETHISKKLSFENCDLREGFDFDKAIFENDLVFNGCVIRQTSFICNVKLEKNFIALGCLFWGENTNKGNNEEKRQSRDALVAFNIEAKSCVLDGSHFIGQVDLLYAKFSGQFSAVSSKFFNPGFGAVVGESTNSTGWIITGSRVNGAISMREARIDGQFDATSCKVIGANDYAIMASGLKTDACLFQDIDVLGTIELTGANIIGQFLLGGSVLNATKKDALSASYAVFSEGVSFKKPTFSTNNHHGKVSGCLNLNLARINKILDLQNAEFTATEYRAISLRGTRIDGDVLLNNAQIQGHVFAERIQVENQLSLKDAVFSKNLIVSEDKNKGCSCIDAIADSEQASRYEYSNHALALKDANIGGRLVMPSTPPDGIVDLSRARCDVLEDYASGWFEPYTDRSKFNEYFVNGVFINYCDANQHRKNYIVLDGFEYNYFEYPMSTTKGEHSKPMWKARVQWLLGQSNNDIKNQFNPQPWSQASTVLWRMGYEDAAQELSIVKNNIRKKSKDTNRFQSLISFFLNLTARYGYKPWRPVWISIVLISMFSFFYSQSNQLCTQTGLLNFIDAKCTSTKLFIPSRYTDFEEETVINDYPKFHSLFYSIDLFVPFLDMNEQTYWLPNTKVKWVLNEAVEARSQPILSRIILWSFHSIGWLVYIAAFLERIFGAFLLAIAITAFTGMLTRTEK